MNPLIQQLINDGPILTDGAWGTELQTRGLPLGCYPDTWNLDHPDQVAAVARAYVDAGSQVILTNTFGANRITLARYGLAEQTVDINRAGAAISRSAAGAQCLVFGSLEPCGSYPGELLDDEMKAAFREQALALAGGGVDGLVIETMTDLAEAVLAVEAAQRTGLPVVACMAFESTGQSPRWRVTPERAAEALATAGADVVGANCGDGPASMLSICRRLRAAINLPLWIKPNAGLPEWVDGRYVYRLSPEQFAADAAGLVTAGASFIGGCCGAGPEHIQALRRRLRGERETERMTMMGDKTKYPA